MTDPIAIAAQFTTRLAPVAAEPVGHGHIHETYVITCRAEGSATERILLQRVNGAVFRDVDALADNRARITEHLQRRAAERGQRPIVAEVISTRSGASMHIDETGTAWRAARFVEGTRPLGPDATTNELRAAARAFAELTRDLDDLPPPALVDTIPHFHDFARRRANLAASVAADRASRVGTAGDLIAEATALADQLEHELATARADDLPMRVVHNDAKLDNVLVDTTTGAVACIVDLDTVMAGTVLNDFGELTRTAATTRPEDEPDVTRIELDHERFAALACGYVSGSSSFLHDSERDCLALAGPLMSLENAVRFLTDHLAGDVYFRVVTPGQNLARHRTQLAHAQVQLDAFDDLRRAVRWALRSS
jgi:hypothetical protein